MEAPSPARPKVPGPPTDNVEPVGGDAQPVRLHPACVSVHPNVGARHCLYHTLDQAVRARGGTVVGVARMREQLAAWLGQHLDAPFTPDGGVAIGEAIASLLDEDDVASVGDYLANLRWGVDAEGNVVYGGAVEVAAFVASHPDCTLSV